MVLELGTELLVERHHPPRAFSDGSEGLPDLRPTHGAQPSACLVDRLKSDRRRKLLADGDAQEVPVDRGALLAMSS